MVKGEKKDLPKNITDITDDFLQSISVDLSTVAVGLQGGFARLSYDGKSDFDILLVFKTDEESRKVFKGLTVFRDRVVGARHISLDRIDIGRWKDKQRFVYADETMIYSDVDKRLENIIRAAAMSRDEQMWTITYMLRKLGNAGLVYHNLQGSDWRNMKWESKLDYWINRGNPAAAHVWLNESAVKLTKLLFAVNGHFLPSMKYRYAIMQTLEWLPENFDFDFKELMCYSDFDSENYYRRAYAAIRLIDACVDKADADGNLTDNMGEMYASRNVRFSDNNI